jgi:hydroxyacylglutathione hydrolase
MRVSRLGLGPLETNCWIFGDDADGPVVVVDPAGDAQAVLNAVNGRAVEAIVLTHGHFDHLGAVGELVERTGARFAMHTDDAASVTSAEGNGGALFGFDVSAPAPTWLLADGDTFAVGAVRVCVLHTPGHTPGGICLLAEDGAGLPHLFSGDTLFAGSVGRTDFPGGDARALARSIAESLAPLDPEVIVHPGHGPDTTIGREARTNFFWPRAARS